MKSGRKKRAKEVEFKRDAVAKPHAAPTAGMSWWLLPGFIVLVTGFAFLPLWRNGFVNWDDDAILLKNFHYRGLGWSQLGWMFTTYHMGHYQPLTWLTFAVDYLIWGMDPVGYHLSNLWLHAANAVLFYFIALRLLTLTRSGVVRDVALRGAAAFATLFFAIHPLRVESVAWATERRDVLSGLFFLTTILCYLRYAALAGVNGARWKWMISCIVLYCLSLLAKASGMTLPLVLLVLDIYPLRRLSGSPKNWFAPACRHVWWEKLPFLFLGGVFGIIALRAQQEAGALAPFEEYGLGVRLAQIFSGVSFYLWKTLLPFGLSPLYRAPTDFDPLSAPVLTSTLVVVAITGALFALRRRYPAGLALWVYYVIVLFPVLGVAQSGSQFVADRYSYLSCLGWAVLAGAAVLQCWELWAGWGIGGRTRTVVGGLAGVVLVGLGVLTWGQVKVWRDSETLWRYALDVGQESSSAHNNLGNVLAERKQWDEAIEHYRQALRINPKYADAHYNLAVVLEGRGQIAAAIEQYRETLRLEPNDASAHRDLGSALAARGQLKEAMEQYREALRINPTDAEAHNKLAVALAMEGNLDESIQHLRKVLDLESSRRIRLEAHYYLGIALARQGDLGQAGEHFEEALKLKPDFAEAQHYLGRIVAAQGDLSRAIDYFRQAIRTKPEFAEAHQSLSEALAQQGNREEAIQHYEIALRIFKSRRKVSDGPPPG